MFSATLVRDACVNVGAGVTGRQPRGLISKGPPSLLVFNALEILLSPFAKLLIEVHGHLEILYNKGPIFSL